MRCCWPHSADAARLFSRLAWLDRLRYRQAGFERSQRQLIEGIQRAGIDGASVLEIGSGVGAVHQHLLQTGAARATGIDLAERMIVEARALARTRGLEHRTDYRVGDFVELADGLDSADIVILDKVICCDPDPQLLTHRSLAKTRRVYAYTIPRDRWYTRVATALVAATLRVVRSRFRPYVHDPEQVERWIDDAGFPKQYENRTLFWLTRVHLRSHRFSG